MERHLNLIKNDELLVERRVLPRFPFTYLTFKNTGADQTHATKVFEVKDISHKGMQLSLKDGGHDYHANETLKGTLHWREATLDICATVEWVKGERLGVSFDQAQGVGDFLSVDNIIQGMRPLHGGNFDMEVPVNLKYWVRSDGPVELFVWTHNDGEISKFQLILHDKFIEWEDGLGVKTGSVLTKRDLDTPLITEDEFMFKMDEGVDMACIAKGQDIVKAIPESYLSVDIKEFLIVKLH